MAITISLSLLGGILFLTIAKLLRVAFRKGIREIPGPRLARFTPFYRINLVVGGDAVNKYRQLHERYGPFVRTGPNSVAIADPKAIPIIYGISSRFMKVCASDDLHKEHCLTSS